MIHRCYGAINIVGKIYRVKITLKESLTNGQPQKSYSYEIANVELLDDKTERPSNDSQTFHRLSVVYNHSFGFQIKTPHKPFGLWGVKNSRSIAELRHYLNLNAHTPRRRVVGLSANQNVVFGDDGGEAITAVNADVEDIGNAEADARGGSVFEEVHGLATFI